MDQIEALYQALRRFMPPRQCERVLIDVRAIGRALERTRADEAVNHYARLLLPRRWRRAWLFTGPLAQEWDQFEAMAAQVGQHISVFDDPEDALRWLTELPPGADIAPLRLPPVSLSRLDEDTP